MNRSSTLQAVAAALFVTCFACIAATDEARPLDALPYTPALDVEAMDRSIDPCVDFYEYSCGGWKRRNPIPPDQAHWDVYTKLATENLQFLSPEEVDSAYKLDGRKTLCNVGSVGQPRDGNWRACYVVLDNDTIKFRRVEYDVETTIKKIYDTPDLENFLGDRLREGR